MKSISQLDLVNISKAFVLAAKYHTNQQRKFDDSPYINHLIEVFDLLTTVGVVQDSNTLCAGILHDIIEDTDISETTLKRKFDPEVYWLVKNLSEDKSLPQHKRREKILNDFLFARQNIKQIKLADMCSNISHIPSSWPLEKISSYVNWLDKLSLLCKDGSIALFNEFQSRKAGLKSFPT